MYISTFGGVHVRIKVKWINLVDRLVQPVQMFIRRISPSISLIFVAVQPSFVHIHLSSRGDTIRSSFIVERATRSILNRREVMNLLNEDDRKDRWYATRNVCRRYSAMCISAIVSIVRRCNVCYWYCNSVRMGWNSINFQAGINWIVLNSTYCWNLQVFTN